MSLRGDAAITAADLKRAISQARRLGLLRRIDWEGELIPVVAELLSLAAAVGVLSTFFLFIDQLEDLFGRGITPVRRSRVLTDLRGLIDVIDMGAPIGLVLSWTPHFDEDTRVHYPALHSRLQRRRVDLPFLQRFDADGFAAMWLDSVPPMSGATVAARPSVDALTMRAWKALKTQGELYPPGERATPRDLLTALAREVDRLAGLQV